MSKEIFLMALGLGVALETFRKKVRDCYDEYDNEKDDIDRAAINLTIRHDSFNLRDKPSEDEMKQLMENERRLELIREGMCNMDYILTEFDSIFAEYMDFRAPFLEEDCCCGKSLY